ncbi:MAG: hypothetical protein ACW98I_03960 [Candidatus Hodarchaeales archaeon]|jgi:hypothetical protein
MDRKKLSISLIVLTIVLPLTFSRALFYNASIKSISSPGVIPQINEQFEEEELQFSSKIQVPDLPFEFDTVGPILKYEDPAHDLITVMGRAQPEDADFDILGIEFGRNHTHLFINTSLRGDPGRFWSKGYHSDLGGVDLIFAFDTGDANDKYPNNTMDTFQRQKFSAARVFLDPKFTWNYTWQIYDPLGDEKGYTWDNELAFMNSSGLINGEEDTGLQDTVLGLFGDEASAYDPRAGRNTTTTTYYSDETRTVYTALPWHYLGITETQDLSEYTFNFTAFTCNDFLTADAGGEADDIQSGIFDVIGDDTTVELMGNTSMIHSWLEVDFGNNNLIQHVNYEYQHPVTGESRTFEPTREKIYLDIPWDIPKGPDEPWLNYHKTWASNDYTTNLRMFSIQQNLTKDSTTFRIYVTNDSIENYIRNGAVEYDNINYTRNPYDRARETIDWSKVSIFVTVDILPGGQILLPTREDAAVNGLGAWEMVFEISSADDLVNKLWSYNSTTDSVTNQTFQDLSIFSNQDKFDKDFFGRELLLTRYLNITLPTDLIRPPIGDLVRFGIFTITKQNITGMLGGEEVDLPDVVDVSSGAWAWKAQEPRIQEVGADPGYDEVIPAGAQGFNKSTRMLHSFLEYDFSTNNLDVGVVPISNLISSTSEAENDTNTLNGLPDNPKEVDISGVAVGYRFDRHDVAWGVEDPGLEREFSALVFAVQMNQYINITTTGLAILLDLEDGGDTQQLIHSDINLSLDMTQFNWDYAIYSTDLNYPAATQVATNWDGNREYSSLDTLTVLDEDIITDVKVAGSIAYFEIENSLFLHSISPDRSISGEMFVISFPNPDSTNLSTLPSPPIYDIVGNLTGNEVISGIPVDLSVPGPVVFPADVSVASYGVLAPSMKVLDNKTFSISANITDPDGLSGGVLTRPTVNYYTTNGEVGNVIMTKVSGTNDTYEAKFPSWLQTYNSTWLSPGWTGATFFYTITAFDVFNNKGGTISLMSLEIVPSDFESPEFNWFVIDLWIENVFNTSLQSPFEINYTMTDDDFIRINTSASDSYWINDWSLNDENGTQDVDRIQTFLDVRSLYGLTTSFVSGLQLNLSIDGGDSFSLRDLKVDRNGGTYYEKSGILFDPSTQLGPFFPNTEVHLNIVAKDVFGNSVVSDSIIINVGYKIPPTPPNYRSSLADLVLLWVVPFILVISIVIALKPDLIIRKRN